MASFAAGWASLSAGQKVDDLNKRLKALEVSHNSSDGGMFGSVLEGDTMGQAEDHVPEVIPGSSARIKLSKNANGTNWVVSHPLLPDPEISGGRYVRLSNGKHFDILDDIDPQGYVTLHG